MFFDGFCFLCIFEEGRVWYLDAEIKICNLPSQQDFSPHFRRVCYHPLCSTSKLGHTKLCHPKGPEDAWREIMGTQFSELLGLQTPPTMLGLLEEWVRKGIKNGKVTCRLFGNTATVTFKPAGQAPRGPSFVCPGTGSLRPRSQLRTPRARPRSKGRTGRLGLGSWPRAALPVGSASSSRQGLSIFRAEEATISRAERPPGLPFLAAASASPEPLGLGGHRAGPHHAPAPQTLPGHGAGWPGLPHAHRPARLPLAHVGTPAPPPAPR